MYTIFILKYQKWETETSSIYEANNIGSSFLSPLLEVKWSAGRQESAARWTCVSHGVGKENLSSAPCSQDCGHTSECSGEAGGQRERAQNQPAMLIVCALRALPQRQSRKKYPKCHKTCFPRGHPFPDPLPRSKKYHHHQQDPWEVWSMISQLLPVSNKEIPPLAAECHGSFLPALWAEHHSASMTARQACLPGTGWMLGSRPHPAVLCSVTLQAVIMGPTPHHPQPSTAPTRRAEVSGEKYRCKLEYF